MEKDVEVGARGKRCHRKLGRGGGDEKCELAWFLFNLTEGCVGNGAGKGRDAWGGMDATSAFLPMGQAGGGGEKGGEAGDRREIIFGIEFFACGEGVGESRVGSCNEVHCGLPLRKGVRIWKTTTQKRTEK